MKEWLKKWWAVLLGAIVSLVLLGKKPKWVKEMEKGIKRRDEEIGKIVAERDKLTKEADEIQDGLTDFEGMVKKQDEDIAEAGRVDRPDPITDPAGIVDFIRERGSGK